jgi:hypothetical protein
MIQGPRRFPLLLILMACVYLLSCGSGGSSGSNSNPPPPGPTFTAPLPWVYSQIYSSASPFHTTVASLKSGGATVLSQSVMDALWSQGVASQDLSEASWMFPVYVASASDPIKTFTCTKYGSCSADGMQVHVPSGALPEAESDGHIGIVDTTQNVEVDGWQCTVGASSVDCSWGGKYAFGGNGIENTGSNAVHAGYAAGAFLITAQELTNGEIDHALGMLANCLNDPTVFPADQHSGTDSPCGGAGPPSYGNLIHLLWTPDQIAASGYSTECRTILTALATYGAYTVDTGNGGLALLTQHQYSYTAIGEANPWQTSILPDLVVAGDASGTYWNSCLNRLGSSDFEILQIAPGSY